ncbi:putative Cbb3-type cytochrome c oxidase maturation protein [Teredinibacter turnerae T7901]|uniref:Cbb3-type cytochrome c oxidase maturation protein n=1 Tax=Teredinibacter turnerae (strain ATCC 39867 / T7901) TaxID=377629 RepID=C5BNJ4_TERTT|nr:cbb3-type cytochrome oxidase assembly protein CcoS [Teredinibacter turnerae]ACR11643.1 putative Cbb3-type cytochrome c oxidase maturation protein [Teredinibacter turnerae T7901]
MESLFILIPIAIVFVIIAVSIFFWAVRSGQYEDLDTEARRILFDEDEAAKRADSAGPHSSNSNDSSPKNSDTTLEKADADD